jgi:hypothetical protein
MKKEKKRKNVKGRKTKGKLESGRRGVMVVGPMYRALLSWV